MISDLILYLRIFQIISFMKISGYQLSNSPMSFVDSVTENFTKTGGF